MIYYISLDNPHPSGGVKTQYRHVEILNRNGIPARMLHQIQGFTSAIWFESYAPISYNGITEIGQGDVLVWPEILRSSIHQYPRIKNVIFNQNIHYTFRGSLNPGLPIISNRAVYDYAHGAMASMVLTVYERDWLKSICPTHPVGLVEHGIDPGIFGYDGRPKKQQIAYMPRKHQDEAEAVIGWLVATGTLQGWDIVEIDQRTERESAEILKDSALFFAFGYPEGGTLPPFEAMAAGANVIGYGGFASDRMFGECWHQTRLVPSGDTCTFASKASHILKHWKDMKIDPMDLSRHVLKRFDMKVEEERLVTFMKGILNG